MDFTPDPDEELIREAVRAVCGRFDDAYWSERDARHEFPWDFYGAMADGGQMTVSGTLRVPGDSIMSVFCGLHQRRLSELERQVWNDAVQRARRDVVTFEQPGADDPVEVGTGLLGRAAGEQDPALRLVHVRPSGVGRMRPPGVDHFAEPPLSVPPHEAFVALVRLDQFAFPCHFGAPFAQIVVQRRCRT